MLGRIVPVRVDRGEAVSFPKARQLVNAAPPDLRWLLRGAGESRDKKRDDDR